MHIGPYRLRNNVALAPMAGLADVPFRTLAWEMGVGYMVSEMVSSKPELWETGKSRLRRVPVPGARPVAVQIAGADPQTMAEAARRHADDGVDVVDINFGCPAKKVCRKAAGSALLSDVALIGKIVERVARAVDLPVTVKTRTGLTPADDAGLAAAKVAEAAGARLVVVHARSRACGFRGAVDYTKVREIKAALRVPVVVNGDVHSAASAARALAASGADGVMVGRGAVGRPWLFRELCGGAKLARFEQLALVMRHLELALDFYGEATAVRLMRKHLKAYLVELGSPQHVAPMLRLRSIAAQADHLARLADDAAERQAAQQAA